MTQERDRTRIAAIADKNWGRAYDLSHRIHANPEIAFEEIKACEWLCDELETSGFSVERGVGGLPTAFQAQVGKGELHVAICAEYDALPDVGHACGHNIIASAAFLAATALVPLAEELDLTVRVIGTPAEESGGGKVILLDNGVFTGCHLAVMVHPGPTEADRMGTVAASHLAITYTGKEAHAAGAPQLGVNALDALTVAQVALGLTRQHLYPYDMVHGIVTKGGAAANIIPSDVAARYIVRSRTLADLEVLRPKIERCFEAGAIATGAQLTIAEPSPTYSELRTDEDVAAAYRKEAAAWQRVFPETGPTFVASTDMGNISYEVASLHPLLSLDCFPVVNHQPEFTAAAASPQADRAVYGGACSLASTIAQVARNPELRTRLVAAPCR